MKWSIIFRHTNLDKKNFLILENRRECSLLPLPSIMIELKGNFKSKFEYWVSKVRDRWPTHEAIFIRLLYFSKQI